MRRVAIALIVLIQLPGCAAREYAIGTSAMGPIRLGMSLEDVRALKGVTVRRTTDGDNAALVEVRLPRDAIVVMAADENDPEEPINWKATVSFIETFSPAFTTAEGVRVGQRVVDVERIYGRAIDIMKSEIEQREYIEFDRQPAHHQFRIDDTGIFDEGSRRSTRFKPEARIYSISISPF